MEILNPEYAKRAIGLLIFDLDGTLADTVDSIREGVNLTMQKHGYPPRSREQIRRDIGNGARELIRLSISDGQTPTQETVSQVLRDYDGFYGETYSHISSCYDGVIEALGVLRQRGYAMAVLSNKQDAYVKALVKQLIPEGWMLIAMGQTELPKKPNPHVPLMIARTLGFAPEACAMIGDSEVDVKTALNANMTAVGCSWGYRERALLTKTGAHAVLDSPAELKLLFD